MSNFILSCNVVMPLFVLMGLGYFCRRLFDDAFLKKANLAVFRIFLPVMLFISIYRTDLQQVLNWRLLGFALAATLLFFLLLLLVIPHIEKNNQRRSALIQGIYRSNFIIFGIPVANNILGTSAVGVASLLIALVVPLFNVLAVITLEMYSTHQANKKAMLQGIIHNPLIIGALLGILFLVFKIPLPGFLEQSLVDISQAATPIALMILGSSFHFSQVKGCLRDLVLANLGKLVVMPGLILPIAIGLGFRGAELVALLAMTAAPTAVSSFTMAQQMDADSELAGAIVVFTSLFSIFTVFCLVFLFSSLGYF